jgi:hypothetical protein
MTAGDEELIRARELFMILSTLEFAWNTLLNLLM